MVCKPWIRLLCVCFAIGTVFSADVVITTQSGGVVVVNNSFTEGNVTTWRFAPGSVPQRPYAFLAKFAFANLRAGDELNVSVVYDEPNFSSSIGSSYTEEDSACVLFGGNGQVDDVICELHGVSNYEEVVMVLSTSASALSPGHSYGFSMTFSVCANVCADSCDTFSNCTECVDGYYPPYSSCSSPCNSRCSACLSASECTECKDAYYYPEVQCTHDVASADANFSFPAPGSNLQRQGAYIISWTDSFITPNLNLDLYYTPDEYLNQTTFLVRLATLDQGVLNYTWTVSQNGLAYGVSNYVLRLSGAEAEEKVYAYSGIFMISDLEKGFSLLDFFKEAYEEVLDALLTLDGIFLIICAIISIISTTIFFVLFIVYTTVRIVKYARAHQEKFSVMASPPSSINESEGVGAARRNDLAEFDL